MAKVWVRASDNSLQLREHATEEAMDGPPPGGATVIDFDEDAPDGRAVVTDIRQTVGVGYTISGGVLRKNGSPVALPADGDRAALRKAAVQVLADNATFLAIANPSNAQNAAQIKSLTQQMNRVIRRLLQLDKVT